MYEARSLILVDQSQRNLLAADPLQNTRPADNSFMASEVEILRSDALAKAVIKAFDLTNDPDYALTPGPFDRLSMALALAGPGPETPQAEMARVLRDVKRNISVQRRGLTYVISVAVSSSNPERAADLANALAAIHIETQVQAKIAQTILAKERLEAEIGAVTALGDGGALDRMAARSKLEVLTARRSDLETQVSLQVPNSRIVSPALVPIEPSAPQKSLILALALVAGAGLGLSLIVFRELCDDTVTSAAQLADLVDAPVATTIPALKTPLFSRGHIAQHVVNRPLQPFSDAVRRLKAAIEQRVDPRATKQHGAQTVLVTSAAPGEGKTTVALSLARVYAQAGRNTLLIDADFRKPRVHSYARIRSKRGLADYLRDPKVVDLRVVTDPKSGLTVIPGGRDARFPTDTLAGSKRFAQIVAAAQKNFDVVIIDSPPMMPAADARYFVRFADAVLLVVRYGRTQRPAVESAAQALSDAMRPDAQLLSVLNQQSRKQRDYDKADYYSARPVLAARRSKDMGAFGT